MAEEIVLKIKNMHCSSCAMNIDGALEDAEGVAEASTSYARKEAKVKFDPEKISREKITQIIESTGYEVGE